MTTIHLQNILMNYLILTAVKQVLSVVSYFVSLGTLVNLYYIIFSFEEVSELDAGEIYQEDDETFVPSEWDISVNV